MMLTKTSRIPSLDGIRGLSILLVVVGHAIRGYFHLIDIANLGVRIFFIISAYLIVGILYKDVLKKRFSLKIFYFKRLMRTFPAFYTYLLIVLLLLLGLGIFDFEQFWRAPVYLENYHSRTLWNDKQWFIGHSWSLAVEEQFYIIIAIIFYFYNKGNLTLRGVINILLILFILSPLVRGSYFLFKNIPDVFRGSIHRSFETVVDSIAIGGILALLPVEKLKSQKLVTYFKNKTWLLLIVIMFIQFLNSSYIRQIFGLKIRFVYNIFGLTFINLLFAVIIFNCIQFSNTTRFNRFLNNKILVFVGTLSYSIYLWQQLWLYKWEIPMLFKILGILTCSLLSYFFIELKFMKIRNKLIQNLQK